MTNQQLIPLIVVAVVVPLVLLRNRRARTLRPNQMWILPLIIVLMIGFGLWATMTFGTDGTPPAPLDAGGWGILAIGLAVGAVIGWWRGKMVVIQKDADGTLKAQASPLGLILIVLLLLGRQALRPWLESHAADWHVNPLALQDAFMLFAVGLVVVQRIEMWIRARRILEGGSDDHMEATA